MRRTVKVDRQLLTVNGGTPTLSPVQAESSNRTAAVPDAVITALSEHVRQFGVGPDGLLFTTDDGQPIRRDKLGLIWRSAAKVAKVADRSPHDLRHYAASVMIANGASVKQVQRQLGHEKATTTLDTYPHLWPDSEDSTRKALSVGLDAVVSSACPAEAVKR